VILLRIQRHDTGASHMVCLWALLESTHCNAVATRIPRPDLASPVSMRVARCISALEISHRLFLALLISG
jgi:hypothetical protein